MKISIVIATFSAAKCVAACLNSCINQTWQDKEIIVIDGGSTDGTVELIRQYAPHLAYWVSEKDKGIYDAWNKAIAHVTGSWVLFRGADDVFWDETVLEKATPGLATASSTELLCYGAVASVNEDQEMVGIRGGPWEDAKDLFHKRMTLPHTGLFHHIQLFQRFGGFDTSYQIAGDYDFLLRATQGGVQGKFLTGLIVTKMSGVGISNTQGLLTKRESIRALKENGVTGFPMAQCTEMAVIAFRTVRRNAIRLILGPIPYERLRRAKQGRLSGAIRAKALAVLSGGGQSK